MINELLIHLQEWPASRTLTTLNAAEGIHSASGRQLTTLLSMFLGGSKKHASHYHVYTAVVIGTAQRQLGCPPIGEQVKKPAPPDSGVLSLGL